MCKNQNASQIETRMDMWPIKGRLNGIHPLYPLESNFQHYNDVIMDAMASQITSLVIVYSIVYSGADQIKHQSSASLAFVRGIHWWPVNSPHKWPVTRKMFPFDDVIINYTRLVDQYQVEWWPSNVGCQAITGQGKHWSLIKMFHILLMTFSSTISWMKTIFQFEFHWRFYPNDAQDVVISPPVAPFTNMVWL